MTSRTFFDSVAAPLDEAAWALLAGYQRAGIYDGAARHRQVATRIPTHRSR